MPAPLAGVAAGASESVWRALPPEGHAAGHPPRRLALVAQECTIDISRARDELGYEPVRTIAEGMEELRASCRDRLSLRDAQPSASRKPCRQLG